MKKILSRIVLLTSTLLITNCGGGGGGGGGAPAAPSIEWVKVTYLATSSTAASLDGTAWVSDSYYASTCAGLSCILDTTRTNDYPGVDVTYVNLTTGVTGHASSYYGPGTNWVHKWYANIPVVSGSNSIKISAYDPSGKGGDITVVVVPPAPPPPLTVLSTSPTSDATGVLVNTTIGAQLSSAIDPSSNYIRVNGPNGAVTGTLTANGSTVTFTPGSNLGYNTTYTATLPTSLRALSGSSLTSDYTWSFTTMAFPAFYVMSTYPAAGATNVPRSLYVSATFNGIIDIYSIGPSSFFLSSPSGAWGSFSFSIFGEGKTVSFSTEFDQLQANTTYTATITTAVRDMNGNPLPFDYLWTFTTGN